MLIETPLVLLGVLACAIGAVGVALAGYAALRTPVEVKTADADALAAGEVASRARLRRATLTSVGLAAASWIVTAPTSSPFGVGGTIGRSVTLGVVIALCAVWLAWACRTGGARQRAGGESGEGESVTVVHFAGIGALAVLLFGVHLAMMLWPAGEIVAQTVLVAALLLTALVAVSLGVDGSPMVAAASLPVAAAAMTALLAAQHGFARSGSEWPWLPLVLLDVAAAAGLLALRGWRSMTVPMPLGTGLRFAGGCSIVLVLGMTWVMKDSAALDGPVSALVIGVLGVALGVLVITHASYADGANSTARADAMSLALVVAALAVTFRWNAGLGVGIMTVFAWCAALPLLAAMGEENRLQRIAGKVIALLSVPVVYLVLRVYTDAFRSHLRYSGIAVHYTVIGLVVGIILGGWALSSLNRHGSPLLFVAVIAAVPAMMVFLWDAKAVLGLCVGVWLLAVASIVLDGAGEAAASFTLATASAALVSLVSIPLTRFAIEQGGLDRQHRTWLAVAVFGILLLWTLVTDIITAARGKEGER